MWFSLLKVYLEIRGQRVFIDIDGMLAGKFDENLLKTIDRSRTFLLVLSPNTLDRCVGDLEGKDWVHRVRRLLMEGTIWVHRVRRTILEGMIWVHRVCRTFLKGKDWVHLVQLYVGLSWRGRFGYTVYVGLSWRGRFG